MEAKLLHPNEYSPARKQAMLELGKSQKEQIVEHGTQIEADKPKEKRKKQKLVRLFTLDVQLTDGEFILAEKRLNGYKKVKVILFVEVEK